MSASREKKNRQERVGAPLSASQKKAQEEQRANQRTTIIFFISSAVLLLFVAGLLVWNSGIIQKNAAAVSINGKNYPASDVAYYYYNRRASLQNNSKVDLSTSLRTQIYNVVNRTWFDYISDEAISSMANTIAIAQAANEAGFDGGDTVKQSVNDTMSSLSDAASQNGYSVSQYLKLVFASLVSRSDFERNVRLAALAEAYADIKTGIESYSAEELEAARQASPEKYDMVDFEYAMFSSASDSTEEESDIENAEASEATGDENNALAEVKERAEQALTRVQAGESLEKAAEDLAGSYSSTITYFGSDEMSEWLFDSARKDGDATVLDYGETGFITLVFHSRKLADYHTASVRHILVSDEETANNLLAQYNAGDKTEESFAALATENSTDPGSSENGGLYTDIYVGQMVKPFEDWCFDASRQAGDTGIVQTDYGYHVMYYVGSSEYTYWQQAAASTLAQEWSDSITANLQTEKLDGMKYIDP